MIFVKRLLTGEYEQTARAAIRLIERVEDKYGIESCVEDVYCRPVLTLSACYYTRDHARKPGIIRVPCLPPRSRKLKELTYHELGHALLDNYKIRSILKHFTRRKSVGWQYQFETWRFARLPRKEGFVSGYAMINAEEDFAECLSAFLCNRNTLNCYIHYNGKRIAIHRCQRIRKKLDAIANVLRFIGS